MLASEFYSEAGNRHQEEVHGLPSGVMPDPKPFDNLNSLLLALEKGEITVAGATDSLARYITARNDHFEIVSLEPVGEVDRCAYSMMTLDKNSALCEKLNAAITALKADGTIDRLVADHLEAFIDKDPVAVDMPRFEGAQTVRIAVTGDLPPMDFTTADGKAAGFNVALLSAVAEHAGLNFELVVMDAGARLTALSSGKVDVLFWTNRSWCEEHDVFTSLEVPGTCITEHYFIEDCAFIARKAN